MPTVGPSGTVVTRYTPVPIAPGRPLTSSGQTPPTLILVVDDEPGLRHLACQALERAGYATLQAEDGVEALRMLEQIPQPVALVLSDIRMPNLDGIQLEQTCRERWPGLPVVLMSGEVTRDWVVRLVREGGHQVIRKPFACETLLDAVRAALEPPRAGPASWPRASPR